LFAPALHFRDREALVSILDAPELAAVDRHARLRRQAQLATQLDELRANFFIKAPLSLRKSARLVVGKMLQHRASFLVWRLEASMKIRLMHGALVIGVLIAVATPSDRSSARTNDVALSTRGAAANVSSNKHRYWRHRGGRHPHYGSRRIRT
jgi:hypothetical protein